MSLAQYRSNPDAIAASKAAMNERTALAVIRPSKLEPEQYFTLRILPAHIDWPSKLDGASNVYRAPDTPFVYVWKHIYKDPENPDKYVTFACPKRNGTGNSCPVCDEAWRRLGIDTEDPTGKAMRANREVMFNAVLLDGPKALVGDNLGKVVTVALSAPVGKPSGKTMIEKLLKAAEHPKNGGDILDPVMGYAFTVTKSGSKRDTNYDFAVDKSAGPIPLSPGGEDAIVALIDSQPNIMATLGADITSGKAKALELAGGAPAPRALRAGKTHRVDDDALDDLAETDDVDY